MIRLPRHGASLPVAVAVSCSADRQCLAKITPEGAFIEQLEFEPAKYMPDTTEDDLEGGAAVKIDLSKPMSEILAELTKHPVKTRLSLTGTVMVARDIAHAKIKAPGRRRGDAAVHEGPPVYLRGPRQDAGGHGVRLVRSDHRRTHGLLRGAVPGGGRLDGDARQGQPLAGGHRLVQGARRFHLGSIGGPAARLAQDCIKKVEVLEYPELGMEAVWKIEVEDFPRSSSSMTRATTSSPR